MSSTTLTRRLERAWQEDSALARMLQPLAWAYGSVVALRRRLYARGWLRASHPGVPVIVVGNLTAGGTGKTPLVAWLAERLREAGRRPAIVSRGYGGSVRNDPVRVSASSLATDVGDEPLLLARRTGVPVVVCADRSRAAKVAAAEGADVVISDDGLQHLALRRDFEIVVVDGARRFGNGRLLPAGPLREPAARLAAADMVAMNDGEPPAGGIRFALRPVEAIALGGGERRAVSSFSGRPAWVVAGIGNPQRFVAQLREAGVVATPVDVPDHGVVDLARLRDANDWPILMTEKDAVKYPDCNDPDAWRVKADLVISNADADRLLSRLRPILETRRA